MEGHEEPHAGAGMIEGWWFITLNLTLVTLIASRRQRSLAWRAALA